MILSAGLWVVGVCGVTAVLICFNGCHQNSSKRKKEQDRGQTLIEKLQEEKQRQEDNCRLVLARLRQDKESWFSPSKLNMSPQNTLPHTWLDCKGI